MRPIEYHPEKIKNDRKIKTNPSNTGIFSAWVFGLSSRNLENSAVLGSYAACGGNSLPTFRVVLKRR
jgi:hypothetical protein